jgi:tetratricopeptide (TPR) repeat protein
LNLGMLRVQEYLLGGDRRTADSALRFLIRAHEMGDERANHGLLLLSLAAPALVPEDAQFRFKGDDDLVLRHGVTDLYTEDRRATGRVCRAQRCFEQVLKWQPESSTAHFYLGRTLHEQQGQRLLAIEHYQAARRFNRFDARFTSGGEGWYGPEGATPLTALLYQVVAYTEMSDLVDAERGAHELIRDAPETGLGQWLLGEVLYKAGRGHEAVSALEEAARYRPTWQIYLHLGRVYNAVGQTESAIAAYKKSLNTWPNELGFFELGEIYVTQPKHVAEGAVLLKRYLQFLPRDCSRVNWWVEVAGYLLKADVPGGCTALGQVATFCPASADAGALYDQHCHAVTMAQKPSGAPSPQRTGQPSRIPH